MPARILRQGGTNIHACPEFETRALVDPRDIPSHLELTTFQYKSCRRDDFPAQTACDVMNLENLGSRVCQAPVDAIEGS